MKKTRLLAAIALLSAMWVVAQQTPTSKPESQESGTKQSQSTTFIEGCLASAPGGGFALTDRAGTAHLLSGASSELSGYLGQQIRVTGKESVSTSTPTSDNSSPQSQGTFNVSKVEKISDTCAAAKK
jgi:hypothetical protein